MRFVRRNRYQYKIRAKEKRKRDLQQSIATSSECWQSLVIHPMYEQSAMSFSVPLHSTSLRKISPLPYPNFVAGKIFGDL